MTMASVGELFEIAKGRKPMSQTENPVPGSRRLLQITDLRPGATPRYTVDVEGVDAQEDDILIAWDGANAGTIGYDLRGHVGSTLARLRPRLANTLFTPYVGHFLRSKFKLLNALTTGATIPHVDGSRLRDLRVPLPPLDEQRRIAAILDKADAIRRKRREAIGLTEDLLQAAFLRLVGPGNVSYFEWPVVRVEELTDRAPDSIRSGPFGSALRHSEFVEEGIAVLGIDNAVQNRFAWGERRFITAEKYGGLRRYAVKPGDVILTIMGTPGRSAVVPENIPAAISTKHLATITVRRDLAHPEFLSNAFHRDPSVQRQIRSRHQGAIMPGLNLGLIKELEIRRPPIAVQEGFARTVGRIRAAERRYRATGEVADAFFQSLAQRVFRGDLDGSRQ